MKNKYLKIIRLKDNDKLKIKNVMEGKGKLLKEKSLKKMRYFINSYKKDNTSNNSQVAKNKYKNNLKIDDVNLEYVYKKLNESYLKNNSSLTKSHSNKVEDCVQPLLLEKTMKIKNKGSLTLPTNNAREKKKKKGKKQRNRGANIHFKGKDLDINIKVAKINDESSLNFPLRNKRKKNKYFGQNLDELDSLGCNEKKMVKKHKSEECSKEVKFLDTNNCNEKKKVKKQDKDFEERDPDINAKEFHSETIKDKQECHNSEDSSEFIGKIKRQKKSKFEDLLKKSDPINCDSRYLLQHSTLSSSGDFYSPEIKQKKERKSKLKYFITSKEREKVIAEISSSSIKDNDKTPVEYFLKAKNDPANKQKHESRKLINISVENKCATGKEICPQTPQNSKLHSKIIIRHSEEPQDKEISASIKVLDYLKERKANWPKIDRKNKNSDIFEVSDFYGANKYQITDSVQVSKCNGDKIIKENVNNKINEKEVNSSSVKEEVDSNFGIIKKYEFNCNSKSALPISDINTSINPGSNSEVEIIGESKYGDSFARLPAKSFVTVDSQEGSGIFNELESTEILNKDCTQPKSVSPQKVVDFNKVLLKNCTTFCKSKNVDNTFQENDPVSHELDISTDSSTLESEIIIKNNPLKNCKKVLVKKLSRSSTSDTFAVVIEKQMHVFKNPNTGACFAILPVNFKNEQEYVDVEICHPFIPGDSILSKNSCILKKATVSLQFNVNCSSNRYFDDSNNAEEKIKNCESQIHKNNESDVLTQTISEVDDLSGECTNNKSEELISTTKSVMSSSQKTVIHSFEKKYSIVQTFDQTPANSQVKFKQTKIDAYLTPKNKKINLNESESSNFSSPNHK